MTEKSAYAAAGVDIAAGHKATQLMKTAVQATFGPEVLSDVGSFGGLFDVSAFKEMGQPVLVASTDGVGTKTKVAATPMGMPKMPSVVSHSVVAIRSMLYTVVTRGASTAVW